ncbi:hypothetical protein MKZ26_15495 [Sporosarcina sp. FSL K6-6792]|uniref:hypothetical protein n=1 Tax=Sporosarcina sp. FSL K6-6792 TaxID=2921559 RepID=UPI0030F9EBD6
MVENSTFEKTPFLAVFFDYGGDNPVRSGDKLLQDGDNLSYSGDNNHGAGDNKSLHPYNKDTKSKQVLCSFLQFLGRS